MRRFESGSINSSVFSLVQVILGAGILTFPYCFMQNGIIPGLALLLVGGIMSGYTGVLLIRASDYTKYTKYEDIAHELYGRSAGIAATILFLLALLSANISYTVYVSTFHFNPIDANEHTKHPQALHHRYRTHPTRVHARHKTWAYVLGRYHFCKYEFQ